MTTCHSRYFRNVFELPVMLLVRPEGRVHHHDQICSSGTSFTPQLESQDALKPAGFT